MTVRELTTAESIADPSRCPSVMQLRQASYQALAEAASLVAGDHNPDRVGQRIRLNRIECELHARDAGVRG